MNLASFSMLKQNLETYAKAHEILGIPMEVQWASLKIEFDDDGPASATLVLIPTGEQVRDLAELAIQRIHDSCSSDDAGYAHSDPLEPEG